MKVLILAAGKNVDELGPEGYPLSLTEFSGTALLERIIQNCRQIADAKIIAEFRTTEIEQFHLDDVVSLIDPDVQIISVEHETRGAACSALLAITEIDTAQELLIINGNELIDVDFNATIEQFRSRGLSAGTLTFPSIHPRYSYVRVDKDDNVVEAAEKRPISRIATMGFYWFREGRQFVEAAQEMIRTDDSVNGAFYVSHTLNQLILKGLLVGHINVAADQFHPFKSNRQIEAYENVYERPQP